MQSVGQRVTTIDSGSVWASPMAAKHKLPKNFLSDLDAVCPNAATDPLRGEFLADLESVYPPRLQRLWCTVTNL